MPKDSPLSTTHFQIKFREFMCPGARLAKRTNTKSQRLVEAIFEPSAPERRLMELSAATGPPLHQFQSVIGHLIPNAALAWNALSDSNAYIDLVEFAESKE